VEGIRLNGIDRLSVCGEHSEKHRRNDLGDTASFSIGITVARTITQKYRSVHGRL
jgi:hypothetical protein